MTRWFIRSAALVCSVAVLADRLFCKCRRAQSAGDRRAHRSFKEIVPQFERASGHKLTVKYDATPVRSRTLRRARRSMWP